MQFKNCFLKAKEFFVKINLLNIIDLIMIYETHFKNAILKYECAVFELYKQPLLLFVYCLTCLFI